MTEHDETIREAYERNMGAHNKTEKPIEFYVEEFSKANPTAMAARTGAAYNEETGTLSFVQLGRQLSVSWPDGKGIYEDTGDALPDNVLILAYCFLLHGKLVPTQEKFLAYEEMPWGDVYRKAFRGRCVARFTYMFPNAAAFAAAAEKAGGQKLDSKADAAYGFQFMDGLEMRLLFWERDEEFEPQGQITFSDNYALAFTAEEMAVCGDILLGYLKSFK